MKKILIAAAITVSLVACSKKDQVPAAAEEPQTSKVYFRVVEYSDSLNVVSTSNVISVTVTN